MILLDTNVISELWRLQPDPTVLAWVDAQAIETLFLSAITAAELRFGVAAMPEGKRRTIFHERLEREVLPGFLGRVLAFDLQASKAYAELMSNARNQGLAIGMADGCIAAIAATQGLMVATRDQAPFKAAGVKVIDPWRG